MVTEKRTKITEPNGSVSYRWNGTAWVEDIDLEVSGLSKLTVAPTAPTSPSAGDLWVDTS